MKAKQALGWAAVAFGAVAAYLVVSKVVKTGGKVVDAAVETLKTDLNPASRENVIYSNIPDDFKTRVFDWIDSFSADTPTDISAPEEPVQKTLDYQLTVQSGLGLKVNYGSGLALAERMAETGGAGGMTDYEKRAIRLAESGEPVKAPNPFDFTRIPNIVRDIFN